jgi:hypothetical protein
MKMHTHDIPGVVELAGTTNQGSYRGKGDKEVEGVDIYSFDKFREGVFFTSLPLSG